VTGGQFLAEVARHLPAARCAAEGGTVTMDVPREDWLAALTFARDTAGCDFFDWLTAVDEQDNGLTVVVHLYSIEGRQHVLVRTLVPPDDPVLPTATPLFRGAAWAERETHEMFGVVFDGHPDLAPLLLPEGFEGHPLRKDFPLAARAAQDWPGAREPGEPAASARSRRRLVPPGVPEGWPPA
jgi:NADH-quinone oxidoreductase subunit C